MFNIRPMLPTDWEVVREIYLDGIASGNATFETTSPSWQQWDESHHKFGRFVIEVDGRVGGWCALSHVSRRAVYQGVAEVSVYVSSATQGHGLGHALLAALIDDSEKNGIWTLQASIFPENVASIKLHLRNGFRQVGRRERIGKLKNVWRDTILFERRSTLVGTD